MVDLKLYRIKTGLSVCLISNEGEIREIMVSNEDLEIISKKLKDVLIKLPESKGGIFELGNKTFIVFKVKEGYLVSPIDPKDAGVTYYGVERLLEEIER